MEARRLKLWQARGQRIAVDVTYLQMLAACAAPLETPSGAQVMHAERPTVSFYRYLYAAVGSPWLWFERRRLNDRELADVIHDEAVEINLPSAIDEPRTPLARFVDQLETAIDDPPCIQPLQNDPVGAGRLVSKLAEAH